MGVSPKTYEQWRDHARQAASDDRFTVLWDELFTAFVKDIHTGRGFEYGVFRGLRKAYSLVTGDTEEVVQQQIAKRYKTT